MPSRHIETRNIVFHISTAASRSLCMMKTDFSTNGAAPFEARERPPAVTQEHKQTPSVRFDGAGDFSTKEKKQSLFRRPSVIVVAAALAIVGIGYGAFAMFHSFTHESTDDAFIDVHFVSVAPKSAGRVAVVQVDDNQLVKKGDVLVEIDPRDFSSRAGAGQSKPGKGQGYADSSSYNRKARLGSLWSERHQFAGPRFERCGFTVEQSSRRSRRSSGRTSRTKPKLRENHGTDRWLRDQGSSCDWRLRASGTGAHVAGAATSLGDCQFQRDATAEHATGTTGRHFGGRLPESQIARPHRQHSGRERSGVHFVAAGKRDRQLRESSPARASEDCAR